MAEETLVGLASIIVLGISAQWLAWRVRLPSILLMLLFGFLLGPVIGLIHPDRIMGDLLFPFVSIAVAIILFEGGLTLKLNDLRPVRNVVFNLVSIGVLVTWLLGATAAYYLLGLNLQLALLLGAILVVSGPTVIIPLLIQIRPVGRVSSVVKWEGIVNDPVGAVLAVLVFEAIRVPGIEAARNEVLFGLANTILIGTAFGLLGAVIITEALRRYLVPDSLQNAVTLMVVIAVHTASNVFQGESGLVTVTLMGIILANQPYVKVKHLVEFKENLRVLLIAALFIILAGRLSLDDFTILNFNAFLFVAVLILFIRPITVFVSTIGSDLKLNERLFLAWMAPRGIVAAAVSSIFALELSHDGFAGAEQLVPYTFLVIVGTVAVYGLTAGWVGNWLQVTQPNAQGVVIAGAHSWARDMAKMLMSEGFKVLLVDTNSTTIQLAKQEQIPALQANIVSDLMLDELELDSMGRLLALTSNDEVNSLAVVQFRELFESSELYQIPLRVMEGGTATSAPMLGRTVFDSTLTHKELTRLFAIGSAVEKVTLSETFDFAAFSEFYGEKAYPLFLVHDEANLSIYTANRELHAKPGETLIYLVEQSMVGMLPPPQPESEEKSIIEAVVETTSIDNHGDA